MATRVSHLFRLGELRYEPSPRWVRGELAGETVVDSKDVWLYWEPGRVVPGWCFPRADVRTEMLRPVEPREDERSAPVAEVFDIGDRERVAWVFADPDLEGRIAIDYYRLDRWFEEEEQVVGHPRDPFKRVDVRRSSRHVRVHRDGELVADSTRPLLVFETGLPVRYYLPPEDVRRDLFGPSDARTLCAYKGEASYLSFRGDDEAAWFYPDPLPDQAALRDHIAFFNERVDIEVDGEHLEPPATPWSRRA
jgi:uncharacterized protein (DUF427 family)